MPAKRRRFQFSLRTLMIVVLGYGLLWLITLKWGGYQLMQHYAAVYKDRGPEVKDDGWLEISNYKPAANGIGYFSMLRYRGRASSPAPFILLWRWELNTMSEEFLPIENGPDKYLWFAGFRRAWYKHHGLYGMNEN